MTDDRIGIIDLFAGPGGLGEGFSFPDAAEERARILLSVENDPRAFETLRLRAFLRRDTPPAEWYRVTDDGDDLPDWSETHPARWGEACEETMSATLGEQATFDRIAPVLDAARERRHGETVLIGGPPCQAYSLAGRARNRGIIGYDPADDDRHFLYREYIRILERLRPAAFVMENVKGMLTSEAGAGRVIGRVLEDLESAGDGYTLVPLIGSGSLLSSSPKPEDFIVRAEEHGVPQARHRLFIVGFRSDIIVPSDPMLIPRTTRRTVSEALTGLPPLRSGLSRNDTAGSWGAEVREAAAGLVADETVAKNVRGRISALLDDDLGDLRERSATHGLMYGRDDGNSNDDLMRWLGARRPGRILQHETRGHIPGDLGRYLFAAVAAELSGHSPKLHEFPDRLQPLHRNRASGIFSDRFRVQVSDRPSTTITSHISKDGHYYIHPDPGQVRSLTVREAARLQTFPDDYLFCGPRTEQYRQVGNAVPPFLAMQIGRAVLGVLKRN